MADAKSAQDIMNVRRAYTTGGKLGARQMFVFNEDGTIAGLKQVEPVQASPQGKDASSRTGSGKFQKDKKFGKLSSQMSVSAMSVGAESKVAFSDANYMPKDGQDDGAKIGRMRGKPGITIWNLLLVPCCLFFSMLSAADVLQSSNQILGTDKYPMDKHDANKISANSLSYGFIVAVPFALIIGFLYDLIGRKAVIVSTFLAGAVSTFLIPVVAPSVAGYDACKIVFLQTMVVLLCNPFINDYVTVQSRGLAMGFQQVGLTAGNLISVSGIYTATEQIENYYVSYGILALMQIVWAVLCGMMITEPDVRDEKENKHFAKKSFCRKLFSMLKQAVKACQQDPALLISLIGLIPSRNTASLQQSNFYTWIKADKFSLSPDVAKNTWKYQNIIANACALPQVFILGRLSDTFSPKVMVPAVLVFQIVVMIGYMFCSDPTSWYAYFLSVFQAGSGFMIIVAMQGYASKRVPKMIRGIVMALIVSLSSLGSILYLQVSKQFYDSAPNMVFGILGLFDAVVLVFIVICIYMGKYGDPAPQEDTFGEGNSMKQEDQTADFQKDDEYLDDDFPDVPLYQDIYDEQIPEMSSDREASSFHTKGRALRQSGHSGKVYDDNDLHTDRSGDDIFMGSIRQTNNMKVSQRARQEGSALLAYSNASYNNNSRVQVGEGNGLPGTSFRDIENVKMTGSTVNKSSSDDEKPDSPKQALLQNSREQTVVTRSMPKMEFLNVNKDGRSTRKTNQSARRSRPKRSSSFEKIDRPTLLQELLAGDHQIKEERNEDSD